MRTKISKTVKVARKMKNLNLTHCAFDQVSNFQQSWWCLFVPVLVKFWRKFTFTWVDKILKCLWIGLSDDFRFIFGLDLWFASFFFGSKTTQWMAFTGDLTCWDRFDTILDLFNDIFWVLVAGELSFWFRPFDTKVDPVS